MIDIFGICIKGLPDIFVFYRVHFTQTTIHFLKFCLAVCNDITRLFQFFHLLTHKPSEHKKGQNKEQSDNRGHSQSIALSLHHAISVLLYDRKNTTNLYHTLTSAIEIGILKRLSYIFSCPLYVALLIE